jgi:hypothetical protein
MKNEILAGAVQCLICCLMQRTLQNAPTKYNSPSQN